MLSVYICYLTLQYQNSMIKNKIAYIYIYIYIVSKVGDFSQGWPEDSLFKYYYTKVSVKQRGIPWSLPYNAGS